MTPHARAFLALALVSSAAAAGPPRHERPVCRDGFFDVVSADPISRTDCRRVAKMARAAWDFDAALMGWRAVTEARPLTFRLRSPESLEEKRILGLAKAPGDVFVTSTSVLDDPAANGTLAHELAHIQAFRALGPRSKSSLRVPHYFLEAHGLSLGRAYRDHLGFGGNDYDAGGARIVARISAAEARRILTTDLDFYRGDRRKERVMEAFAVFFIDYLRVHRGIPDAVARMGRVFEDVGTGTSYEKAFRRAYGLSVDEAVAEILDFLERTRSSPAERLRGTSYDGLI